jgi:hypothetical protein
MTSWAVAGCNRLALAVPAGALRAPRECKNFKALQASTLILRRNIRVARSHFHLLRPQNN